MTSFVRNAILASAAAASLMVLGIVAGSAAYAEGAREPSLRTTKSVSAGGVAATTTVRAEFKERRAELNAENRTTLETQRDDRSAAREAGAAASTTAKSRAEAWKAQRASTTAAMSVLIKARHDDLKDRVAAMKLRIQAGKAERKVALEAKTRERVQGLVNSMMTRFRNIARQLEGISGRLEERIGKLQTEKGLDMEKSVAALAEADAKLAIVKDDIAQIDASLKSEITSTTSKESIRAHVTTVKTDAAAAWEAYRNVVKSIRDEAGSALSDGEKAAKATTTAEVTSTTTASSTL